MNASLSSPALSGVGPYVASSQGPEATGMLKHLAESVGVIGITRNRRLIRRKSMEITWQPELLEHYRFVQPNSHFKMVIYIPVGFHH